MTFKIKTQRYPTHTGERPLSFAIYYGRKFLAYSWTRDGAERGLAEIRSSSIQPEDDCKTTTEESHDVLSSQSAST